MPPTGPTLQGLMGFAPATLDPDAGEAALAALRARPDG